MKPRLSLRRRTPPKPPPEGIVLSEESVDRRNFKLADVGQASIRTAEIEESISEANGEIEIEQREAILKRLETELLLQTKEMRDHQFQIEESLREASERLMLADKREAILKKRESLLEASGEDLKNASALQSLRESLEKREARIRELEERLETEIERADKLETTQEQLMREISETQASEKTEANEALSIASTSSDNESGSISHEREAYIEASEEALLLKAQQLEELETHLTQWQDELEARSESASA